VTEPVLSDTLPVDLLQFREVVRNPEAHAVVLGQYRVGEQAGVVGLRRLLDEMEPEGKLRSAMEIHYRDESRHSALFTDWIRRVGVTPPLLPADLEGFFSASPEEHRQTRAMLEALPAETRRIIVFSVINAIERLAYTQFEAHLLCLDRREDIDALESVMAEERFHLHYIEAELERQEKGPNAAVVAAALEQSRTRVAQFRAMKEREIVASLERVLGGGA